VDQPVQRGQVIAIDTQQVIRIAGQGPCRNDRRLGGDQPCKVARLFRPVGGQLHLHESLDLQAQLQRIQLRGIGGDIAFAFKPLAPPPGLAGRQVQHLAQFLRGQMRVLLKRRQKAFVGLIQHMRIFRMIVDFCVILARKSKIISL
jgi:hypothetical protein